MTTRAAVALALLAGTGLGFGLDTLGPRLGMRAGIVAPAAPESAAQPGSGEQVIITVARQTSPSVVSVARQGGSGSGVLVRADGVLITNAHVVGGARMVEVGLADGRRLPGRVLARDPSLDIAVVQVELSDAPAARIGDSDRLQVGQTAIAIGNPLGFERTVTTGVVSALNRSPTNFPLEGGLIQTDAAISPGNSGGPLLDSQGRVIGINSAIITAPGASGIGFAIPINDANDVVQQVLTTGRITRAFLGIQYGDIDPQLAQQFNLPVRQGIVVLGVAGGSPAARAGVRPEDIITQIGEQPIRNGGDLRSAMRDLEPGSRTTLTLVSPRGGGPRTVPVTLAQAGD
jgi:S1-C subfamily serine protease